MLFDFQEKKKGGKEKGKKNYKHCKGKISK